LESVSDICDILERFQLSHSQPAKADETLISLFFIGTSFLDGTTTEADGGTKEETYCADECYSFPKVLPPHLFAQWRAASEQYREHTVLVLLSSAAIV
jgi:hypothetical protein